MIFFGTPRFAAEIFQFLYRSAVPIAGVVTQPDRPKGRSLKPSFSFVKRAVLEFTPKTALFQPEKASEVSFIEELRALKADLFVVVAYGQILSQKLLSVPPLGCINVHASLLPKYRGAAPIQRCLMAGEVETGISIQKMVRELDAGDVIASAKCSIPPEMTAGELEQELCRLSQPLLFSVLKQYEKGIPSATPQDPSLVTYAPKIEVEAGEIHWEKTAEELHNLIRAFSPRPGAWCRVEGKRVKILRSRITAGKNGQLPGEILSQDGIVACGEGALWLVEVQPEGKKAMGGAEWLRGAKKKSSIQ